MQGPGAGSALRGRAREVGAPLGVGAVCWRLRCVLGVGALWGSAQCVGEGRAGDLLRANVAFRRFSQEIKSFDQGPYFVGGGPRAGVPAAQNWIVLHRVARSR